MRWLKKLPKLCSGSDNGSGTVLGALLILLVGLTAFAAVCAGSFLVCRVQAQNLAESTATNLAYALQISETAVPCEDARERFSSGQFFLDSCTVESEDVQVSVRGIPSISFLPQVHVAARAGPASCVPRNE